MTQSPSDSSQGNRQLGGDMNSESLMPGIDKQIIETIFNHQALAWSFFQDETLKLLDQALGSDPVSGDLRNRLKKTLETAHRDRVAPKTSLLSRYITMRRAVLGLSIEVLSRDLTVGLEQLRDLETGVIPPNRFSAKTLLALAERLRAPLTAFVGLIRITVLPSPAVTATAKTATRMKRSTTSPRRAAVPSEISQFLAELEAELRQRLRKHRE